MTKAPRRIFIGSAWPYANGPLHLGHIAALLPADVLARYFRQRGDQVFFDSGSDAHGTPITVRADAEKTTPAKVAERYHALLKKTFEQFGFSYDLYTITTTPRHEAIVQEIFLKLKDGGFLSEKEQALTYCPKDKRFLPDRYIEGICPVCGFDRARGDQCDNCKSLLDPLKLTRAHCTICGTAPTQKASRHFFLKLPEFQKQLEEWVGQGPSLWRDNAVAFTREFLKKGLPERAITRDIDWGIPVPVKGYEGKSIYVWFDGVCGYLSAHRQWAEAHGDPDAWKPFWNPDASGDDILHYYVHGKDNIPFHTIIWPAILLGVGQLRLPDVIVSSEYLTLEGEKFSTSRNWAVWAHDVIERYQPDALRYYLLANGPETRDADFSWDAFVAKTNNELVATYGNFVQRLVSFARTHFPDGLTKAATEKRVPLIKEVYAQYQVVGNHLEAAEFKAALAAVFRFLKNANGWLDRQAPWKTVKTDRESAAITVAAGLEIIANLANLTAPFLPFQAKTLAAALGQPLAWSPAPRPILAPELPPLFAKLDPAVADHERAKLGPA